MQNDKVHTHTHMIHNMVYKYYTWQSVHGLKCKISSYTKRTQVTSKFLLGNSLQKIQISKVNNIIACYGLTSTVFDLIPPIRKSKLSLWKQIIKICNKNKKLCIFQWKEKERREGEIINFHVCTILTSIQFIFAFFPKFLISVCITTCKHDRDM